MKIRIEETLSKMIWKCKKPRISYFLKRENHFHKVCSNQLMFLLLLVVLHFSLCLDIYHLLIIKFSRQTVIIFSFDISLDKLENFGFSILLSFIRSSKQFLCFIHYCHYFDISYVMCHYFLHSKQLFSWWYIIFNNLSHFLS